MRKTIALLTTLGVIMAIVALQDRTVAGSATNGTPVNQDMALESFALIELFTSEGCSSCPPADRLLSAIIDEAIRQKQNIYALSFHVDYWDYIGWKDPYSRKSYSDRQRRYAQAFKTTRIYTPQMIVNGQHEFVGSSRRKSQDAIVAAFTSKAISSVRLNNFSSEASAFRFDYRVSHLPAGAIINFALVEQDLEQNVSSGENRGRVLQHDNVVRSFRTAVSAQGTISLELPDDLQYEKSAVIAYVQNAESMAVLGATRAAL